MKKISYRVFVISGIFLFFYACKKDKDLKPVPPPNTNPPELITGVRLTLKDSAQPTILVYALFADPDGPGGNPPSTIDTIKLQPQTTYLVKTDVINHTKNPVDTLTSEIWNERNDHQFFFKFSGVSVQFFYMDKDQNNYPVGIQTKWKTGNSANGSVRVILKHQAGVKNGTEGPGETDVDVTFPAKIF